MFTLMAARAAGIYRVNHRGIIGGDATEICCNTALVQHVEYVESTGNEGDGCNFPYSVIKVIERLLRLFMLLSSRSGICGIFQSRFGFLP